MPDVAEIARELVAPARCDDAYAVVLEERVAGDVPPSIDLFRSPAFYRLHASSFRRAWYARITDRAKGTSCGGGWFAESAPGEAHSGARGPFGACFVTHDPLPTSLADAVVAATDDAMRGLGLERTRVTLPPAAHEPGRHAEWMNAYLRHGYQALAPELNFHVRVDGVSLPDRMNSGNRAVVRTAERKGMVARLLEPDERPRAYDVNVENRLRRGRPVTMSLDALVTMDAALPGALLWFGVFAAERMIAASICMRLSPDVLYVFYLGDVDGVAKLSPVTLLVAHVHEWCRAQSIALLDLGIATEGGVPNEGLMAYKRNLGFEVSPKYTLTKELHR